MNKMYLPKGNSNYYYKLLHEKRVAELLLCALRYDLFSSLKQWETVERLITKKGLHKRNLELVLNALVSTGFLEKSEAGYRNTVESSEFLAAGSPVDIRESLIFRERMMSLNNLDERLAEGPNEDIKRRNLGAEFFDFTEAARISIPEMYTGRVQNFIAEAKEVFRGTSPNKILDLGAGAGILTIEFIKEFPGSKGVIFESEDVAAIPRNLILTEGLTSQITILDGDFLVKDFGENYDLIIASGILDFAKENLESLIKRMFNALTPNGVIYVVTNQVDKEYLSPPQAILGWLSSHLEGLDILLTQDDIDSALSNACFERNEKSLIYENLQGYVGVFYHKKEN